MWQKGSAFRDRADAGRRLAAALSGFKGSAPVILALPRGGVPVGFEVAKALSAPLDILLVRKVGAPGHEELALGAVVDAAEPQVVVNDKVMALAAPPRGYFEQEKVRQLEEIERRRRAYRGDLPPIPVKGRTVIVVDDGIATAATMRAALRGTRLAGPYDRGIEGRMRRGRLSRNARTVPRRRASLPELRPDKRRGGGQPACQGAPCRRRCASGPATGRRASAGRPAAVALSFVSPTSGH
jgi:predicted phosphoribosyltransferase